MVQSSGEWFSAKEGKLTLNKGTQTKRAGGPNHNEKIGSGHGSFWHFFKISKIICVHLEIRTYLSAMVRLWGEWGEGLWSFQHHHSVSLSLSSPTSHRRAPCLSSSKAPQSWTECQKGLWSPLESFADQQWARPSLASTQIWTWENKLGDALHWQKWY